jgi:hypothetical protein
MLDVPTNISATVANYSVWNPLKRFSSPGNFASIINGNLTASDNTSNNTSVLASMQIPSTGKWYYEVVLTTDGSNVGILPGFSTIEITYKNGRRDSK